MLYIVRLDVGRLMGHVLFRRWRTWAVIAPLYVLCVLGGQVTTLLLVAFLVFQGLREYGRLVGLPASYQRTLLAMGLLSLPVAVVWPDRYYLVTPLFLIVATLQPLVSGDVRDGVRHLTFTVFGWALIAWFLGHLLLIQAQVEEGSGFLLAIGLATALSDVGAFTVGKTLGRHQMAPVVSPNKTWEGVAGNILGAYLGAGLIWYVLQPQSLPLAIVALPAVIAVAAVWGDLTESAIKREFEAKDAGSWLPGFGGLLDRIDSLLLVAPLSCFFLVLAT
jgi:phosphatidate cytidylyltransferase